MRKTFKYRLLANKETFANAENWLELMRKLYNAALAQRLLAWKYNKYSINYQSQQNELPQLRKEIPEYANINAQTLRTPLHRVDLAFKHFFTNCKKNKGKCGFPRFKGINRFHSFTMESNGWKLDGKYLTIRNVGKFKIRLSRPIDGDIKQITIRKESTGKWYVCFSCDNVPESKLESCDKSVGIDVGITTFCTDSDGNTFENPKYFRQSEKGLRIRQRKLARCKRGSNRRNKTRLLVAKAYEKVSDQRNDFLHKVVNHYITNYGVICIEDLNIKGMVRNHNLAKSISDSSWGKFFEFLKYKAEEAGTREIIKIDRFEPSSKTCSVCGLINDNLKLSDRKWICLGCETVHDRDFNAAKNIKRVGQTLQTLTYNSS
jgi:putative transposase